MERKPQSIDVWTPWISLFNPTWFDTIMPPNFNARVLGFTDAKGMALGLEDSRQHPRTMSMKRTQKTALMNFGGAALLIVGLCVHAFLPPVAHSKLARLATGTTRADAERILGRPVEVLIPSAFGTETWRYQVSLRFGWVDVFFDEQGRLVEHNYERF